MGKEPTSSVHPRYEEFGGRIFHWSEKDTQRVSHKGSMHLRDKKPKGNLSKVS